MYENATMNVKLNGRESKALSVKVRGASGCGSKSATVDHSVGGLWNCFMWVILL